MKQHAPPALAARSTVHRTGSVARFVSLLGILVGLGVGASARAATLHHSYRFDAERVRLATHGTGTQIVVDGWPTTWELGAPDLPVATLTFLVPRGQRIENLRASSQSEVVLASGVEPFFSSAIHDDAGNPVEPKPVRLSRAALAARGALDPAVERARGTAGAYPAILAEPAGGGMLHGYQLATVRLYPVHWDEAARRYVAATQIDLEIDLAPGGALPIERRRFSPEIETRARAQIERLVANPEALIGYDRAIGRLVERASAKRGGATLAGTAPGGFRPTDAPSLEGSPVEYVIVTGQATAATWQQLADWKTQRGVPTVVRTIEWIQQNYRHGSDLQETIRTFIRDAYLDWGVEWVLLAGDTDMIPARYGFSGFGDPTEQSIPTDMYFACLDLHWNRDRDGLFGEAAVSAVDPGDSTDMYAEVFVGRAPMSTVAEANAFVGKVIAYENAAVTNYQQQLLLLGEVLFPVDWQPGEPLSLDGGVFNEELLEFVGVCTDTIRLYDNYTAFPGAEPLNRADVIAAMNAGPGFVNHIGHGYRYNMSVGDMSLTNTDALSLTNVDRRFVLYMLNCTAVAFDFPCLAEAFLESPGGAVGVVGSSRSAFAIPARNYNREFFEALHADDHEHLGEAFVQSRLAYTPSAYFDTADHYSHFLYNYLGDPEIVVHTCSLGTTSATHAAALPLGPANLTVQVAVDGVPREGALVCISKGAGGAEAYAYGVTGPTGEVIIDFIPESAGTAQLTVSGQNMRLHQGTIDIVPASGAYVHASNVTLDDDATGLSSGNADGALDAGETVEVALTAVNDGPTGATGVTGVLRIASPHVVLTDSTFDVGAVSSGGGTASSSNGPVFSLASTTPDGAVLAMQFVLTDGVSTWTDVVNRVVHAPDLRLMLLDIDDPAPGGNGNGVIQAGETFNALAFFKNFGTGAADGLLATLASTDPDITIVEDSVAIGRANPQQELSGSGAFRLTEAVLDENPLDITLVDDKGRSQLFTITLRGPGQPSLPVLSTRSGGGIVTLTWTPLAVADLAGYHVYRALAATGPWTRVTVDRTLRTAYLQDTNLTPSTRYYYRVTAVDQSGNESAPSSIANINTNPAQLSGWPIQLGASSSCPVAVGDMTGDGSREIVAGNDHLYAWNWNGLELRDDDNDPITWGIFSVEVKTVTGAVALAEMDGNPGLEAFVTSWDDTNRTYAVRGDGEFLAGWPRNPDPTSAQKGYWASGSAVDVDGDGRAEMFAPAKNGTLYAWHWDGTPLGMSDAFKTGLGISQRTSPSFANLDGDPELEIVYGAQDGQLHVWNVDGSNFPNFPVTHGGGCLSNTAVGDVNHDSVLDVVMVTEGGFVNVHDTSTGAQLPGWPRSLPIKGIPISPSPALADFNGDSFLEIVVANIDFTPSFSAIRVFDHLGNTLPGWPKLLGSSSESSPIVADLSGDGAPDIIFGTENGFLHGWDQFGVALPGFPITIGDFVRSTPFIDDVDADGYANLVLSGWDKNVYVWDFPAPWNAAAAQWPTLKGDVHRSGTYDFVFDIAPPALPVTLTSPSHTASAWSSDATIETSWSAATDPSGIGGYSFVWDTSPATLPDATIDTPALTTTSPPLGQGQSHWFHLRVADVHGNWSPAALHLGPFWIDTTPPVNGLTAGADRAPSVWSNDATIEATWSAAADTGAVASGIGGYSFAWDTSPATFPDAIVDTAVLTTVSPVLADGASIYFHLRAVDTAGNGATDAVHLGPFWIDATAPLDPTTFDTTPPVDTWSVDDSIAVAWSGQSDALSGVAAFSYHFDAAAATLPDLLAEPAGTNTVLTPVADGLHWFHLRTQDAAGNWTATAHVGPFRIDRTPPAVTVLRPNGGEVWAHQAVERIRFQANDATSGIASIELRYSTDGGASFPHLVATLAPTDSVYDWSVPLDLTNQARVRAIALDAAGNPSDDASDADFALTTATDVTSAPPVTRTWLENAAPNPFNPTTTIRYSLLESGRVQLVIFDARGRHLRTLVDAPQAGGRWYDVRWDGRDDAGRGLSSGTYFARLRTPAGDQSRRLVLMQ